MVIYGSFGWIVQDLNLLTSQLSTIVFLEVFYIYAITQSYFSISKLGTPWYGRNIA